MTVAWHNQMLNVPRDCYLTRLMLPDINVA